MLKEELELAKDEQRNMEESRADQRKRLEENEKMMERAQKEIAEMQERREEAERQKRELERQHENGMGALHNEKNGLVKILKNINAISKICGGGRGDCSIF